MFKPRQRRWKDKCYFLIRIVAEDEVEAEEVDSTYPTKGTQNFGKKTEAIEEQSQEKVRKPCHLRAPIAEKSGITNRSAEKKEVSWPQQVDNSQITLRMRNTQTTVDTS